LKGIDHLKDLGVDEWIILKCSLKKYVGKAKAEVFGSG
jgi:hypothetical protein